MRKIDFFFDYLSIPTPRKKKRSHQKKKREKGGMGNCFSSCFPKTFVFEATEEDPETVALREESEKREAELARRHAAEAAARREERFASSSLGKAIKKSELKAKREREEKERAGFTETRRAEQNAKDWLS